MRAADKRHKIVIQQKTAASPAVNAYGIEQFTWTEFTTVFAAVEHLSGREYWNAKQVNAERTVRFRIDFKSGVIPRMRVNYDARNFDVEQVINPQENRRDMILITTEIVDET